MAQKISPKVEALEAIGRIEAFLDVRHSAMKALDMAEIRAYVGHAKKSVESIHELTRVRKPKSQDPTKL
jgi:hypothetical protein